MKFYVKAVLIFLGFIIFGSGCVAKKKHLAAIQTLKTTHEGVVDTWQTRYNEKRAELNASEEKARALELNLAERKGENNVLVSLRDELQIQIENMESQMTRQGSSSQTAEQKLRKEVQQKEGEIKLLQQKLAAVNTALDRSKKMLEGIAGDLAFEMQALGDPALEIISKANQVVLIVPEKSLFKKGSSSQIIRSGETLLEKVGDIISRYPQLLIQVMGHTDNTPANVSRYKDNWNFSALQSASIIRTLVGDYDVNASQLTVGAKGEFEPRTSNSTREGKTMNRRIEFVIYQLTEDLAKDIRAITSR